MDSTTGTQTQRILWAVIVGLAALYCDKRAPAADRAMIQGMLWTVAVFSLLFVELRKTLLRPRQLLVAVLLMAVHSYAIYASWRVFPFDSSFTIIICIVIEAFIVGLVYIRLCQSIDPDGPFGPTEAEKKLEKFNSLYELLQVTRPYQQHVELRSWTC
jgi:hypothetical protein